MKDKKNAHTNLLDVDKVWEITWTYINTVVDILREPFLILDSKLRVISANKTFYTVFHVNKKETVGKLVYDLGNGQWNISKLKILLEDIVPKNTYFKDFEVKHNFPKIGLKIMMLNARQIYMTGEKRIIMLLAMEDVTKEKQLENQLKEYTKELKIEVAKRTSELEVRVRELEKINKIMIGRELRMIELKKEIKKLEKRLSGK